MIIDNLKENFANTCPDNGIEIESWYGDDLDDVELLKLIPFLKALACVEEKDIRKVLSHYRGKYDQYVKDFVWEDDDEFINNSVSRNHSPRNHSPNLTDRSINTVESPRVTKAQFLANRDAKRKILNNVEIL